MEGGKRQAAGPLTGSREIPQPEDSSDPPQFSPEIQVQHNRAAKTIMPGDGGYSRKADAGAGVPSISRRRKKGESRALRRWWSEMPSEPSMWDYVLGMPYDDVAGRYLVGSHELGRGRFGRIFVCVERISGKKYACKTIHKTCIKVGEGF